MVLTPVRLYLLSLTRRVAENVGCLTALTELNLRRNSIEKVLSNVNNLDCCNTVFGGAVTQVSYPHAVRLKTTIHGKAGDVGNRIPVAPRNVQNDTYICELVRPSSTPDRRFHPFSPSPCGERRAPFRTIRCSWRELSIEEVSPHRIPPIYPARPYLNALPRELGIVLYCVPYFL